VPVADEVGYLQRGPAPECRLFQKIAEQGHYAGRTQPTNTRQGTYAAAPSGALLGSANTNDPDQMAEMLQSALAKWKTLSQAERFLSDKPSRDSTKNQRWEESYPKDGLVLRVNARDLPRENLPNDWRAEAWNQDYAWFRKEEALMFLPTTLSTGTKRIVPEDLIHRIARCHLVDNVRGQTSVFPDKCIEKARLTAEVLEVKGDVAMLRYEGEARAFQEGDWPVGGYSDMHNPVKQMRSIEAKFLGHATYDSRQQRFISFEMMAIGARRGGTQYNCRGDDLAAAGMGIAFTLAHDEPSEHVAPASIWEYGWKW